MHLNLLLRSKQILAVFYWIIALFCSACSQNQAGSQSLHLGYTPSDQSLPERRQAFEQLRSYLSRETGLQVELVKTNSYQPAIAAMKRGDIDIMNFGVQAYLIAEEEGVAQAFALRGDSDGKPHVYRSLIIAPANSPYSTIEEATQVADQLHVLYTNKASTSGYLIARNFYLSRGLDPVTSFAKASFSNSHALSILEISNNQADLANVSSRVLDSLIQEGKIESSSLNILWSSNEIPSGPVAYSTSLSESQKQVIREAYFKLPRNEPSTWDKVKLLYPQDDFVYIPVTPNAFDTLRRLRN